MRLRASAERCRMPDGWQWQGRCSGNCESTQAAEETARAAERRLPWLVALATISDSLPVPELPGLIEKLRNARQAVGEDPRAAPRLRPYTETYEDDDLTTTLPRGRRKQVLDHLLGKTAERVDEADAWRLWQQTLDGVDNNVRALFDETQWLRRLATRLPPGQVQPAISKILQLCDKLRLTAANDEFL